MTDDDHTGTMTYIRLPRIKKCRWYRRHRWTEWVDHGYNHNNVVTSQVKTCLVCNKKVSESL